MREKSSIIGILGMAMNLKKEVNQQYIQKKGRLDVILLSEMMVEIKHQIQ